MRRVDRWSSAVRCWSPCSSSTFLFPTFYIPSASMEPTLVGQPKRHDRIIVNRLSYKLHDVHRGDIVVFEKPPGETATTGTAGRSRTSSSGSSACPGETVTLRDGHVYVDGKRSTSRTCRRARRPSRSAAESPSSRCPKGDVFVMGDNRTNSEDSRCFGPIDEDTIVGRRSSASGR